jgi:hypothetical protein
MGRSWKPKPKPKPKPVKEVVKIVHIDVDVDQDNDLTIEKSIILTKQFEVNQENNVKIEIG